MAEISNLINKDSTLRILAQAVQPFRQQTITDKEEEKRGRYTVFNELYSRVSALCSVSRFRIYFSTSFRYLKESLNISSNAFLPKQTYGMRMLS